MPGRFEEPRGRREENRFSPPLPSSPTEDRIWGLLFRSYSPKLGPSHEVLLPPAGTLKEHRLRVELPLAFSPSPLSPCRFSLSRLLHLPKTR